MPSPDGVREHGDFQTPLALAREIVGRLAARGVRPDRILEPTCGAGAFLRAVRDVYGADPYVAGVELRDRYREALAPLSAARTTIRFGDAAELDLAAIIGRPGRLLVVGNLPWVTTDGLARMHAGRGPARTNPKDLRGLDARTGASSFDVAEFLSLRLFDVLARAPHGGTFAMLLKESVARRLVRELHRRKTPVTFAAVTRIDARRAFGVSVDACLLDVDVAAEGAPLAHVAVSPALDAPAAQTWFVTEHVVAADALLAPAAPSGLVWRQGIKHDAAAVFELQRVEGRLVNGFGEAVEIEDDVLFPLGRARDLARGCAHDGRSYLLVPYRAMRGSEEALAAAAPRAHAYLTRHAARLDARRSSIYRGAPRFAIFGVGAYSFAPWKVAVSGLHRDPRFVVVSAHKPVQLSDTAYALGFAARGDALLVGAVLQSAPALTALRSAIFAGKRPVTKRLLTQLDLAALTAREEIVAAAAADAGLDAEAAAQRLRELLAHGRPEILGVA